MQTQTELYALYYMYMKQNIYYLINFLYPTTVLYVFYIYQYVPVANPITLTSVYII